jgi:transposase
LALDLAEQLAGKQAPTQLGQAPQQLGIQQIPAYSPQAKGRIERGKGTKIIALADDHVFLLPRVLGHSFLDFLPERLIGDRAYDSDRLDQDMAEHYGIDMIAPHRGQRREPTQDGRASRRYRKRWRVERLFAWLHHFRRLVIRWEYHVENFLGMVRLDCMQILLWHL